MYLGELLQYCIDELEAKRESDQNCLLVCVSLYIHSSCLIFLDWENLIEKTRESVVDYFSWVKLTKSDICIVLKEERRSKGLGSHPLKRLKQERGNLQGKKEEEDAG